MARLLLIGVLAACELAFVGSIARAVIYSPTQAELFAVEFADFIDNPEPDVASLNSKMLVGGDAVSYNFTTDYDINDNLWRVALENTEFALDLTPYDAFSITFSNPVPPDPALNLSAQIFVRSAGDAAFAASNSVQVNAAVPVTLSIPKAAIVNLGGDPSDITAFGIEFFGGDEFLGTTFSATASTSPQPPTLEDHLLFSWETPDDLSTPNVDERFEGWTTLQGPYVPGQVPHPDHTHSISTIGATEGSHALRIDRAVTGAGLSDQPGTTTFRWGSRFSLDANAGGGGPAIGDYNNDGNVDGGDYVRWRNNLGGPVATLENRDPDNMATTVSVSHYADWKENYGNTAGGPDPSVLAQIANIVALINDPNAYSISFDVRFEDQIPDANPGWTNFFLSIQASDGDPNDGNDAWWQSAQVDLDLSPLASGLPVEATLDFPLSLFDDSNENGIQSLAADGLDPMTQYLAFNFATNVPVDGAPVTYEFYIDNFRVRHIVPEEGGGGIVAGSAPEPSTVLLALLALAAGTGVGVGRFGRECASRA